MNLKQTLIAIQITLSFSTSVKGQSAWTQLPIKFSHILQMRFHDRSTGFVLSGDYHQSSLDTIFKTTDGGMSWNGVSLPLDGSYHVSDFYMLHDAIWLTCIGRRDGNAVRLLRSADIGQSWHSLAFDSTKYPYEVCFSTASLGYLLFRPDTNIGTDTYGRDTLDCSSDGGNSWVFHGRPGDATHLLQCGYTSTVIGIQPAGGQSYEQIVRSSDYGVTFKAYFPGNNCYAGNQVWLAYQERSSDDGATWISADVGTPWADTTGDGYCSIVLADSLRVSHDRGVSWATHPFYPGSSANYSLHIEVVDSLYAYADNFDVIYKTTTGGVGSFDGVSAQASNSGPITVEGFGGLFNVHDASLSTHKVIVFNLLGERVLEVANPRASEFTLDLSMLPAGIYFARFEMAGGAVEMRKIVVEGK